MSEEIPVVTYRCRKGGHVLLRVLGVGDELVVEVPRPWAKGSVTGYRQGDTAPARTTLQSPTGFGFAPTCACRVGFEVGRKTLMQDVAAGTRVVFLDPVG